MTWGRFGQFAMIVLVFALAGPLVGLVAAALASGLGVTLASNLGDGAAMAAFVLIYGPLFAHILGLLPAVIAGGLVAAHAYRRGRVPLVVGAFAGLASMTLMAMLNGMPSPSWRESQILAVAVIWLVTHVVSAVICTRLTRRWQ